MFDIILALIFLVWAGLGVFVNGKCLNEPYKLPPAQYAEIMRKAAFGISIVVAVAAIRYLTLALA